MFRRSVIGAGRVSVGASAATSASASPSAALVIAQQQQQRRSLTSTVLLTRTREQYEAKKIPDLKDELRHRGLATSGRRDELVRRLLNDDVKRAGSNNTLPPSPSASTPIRTKATTASAPKGPRTPPTSDSATPNSQASLASLRNAASSRSSSEAVPKKPKAPKGEAADDLSPVTDTTKVISAGVAIDKHEAAGGEGGAAAVAGVRSPQMSEPVASNPPGVPPSAVKQAAAGADSAVASANKAQSHGKPSTTAVLDIKIPYEAPAVEPGPDIPLVTSYFHPGENISEAARAADADYHSNPKVVAVGGTSDIAYHGADHAPQSDSNSSSGVVSAILAEVRRELGLPSASKVASSVSKATPSSLDEASKAIQSAISSAVPAGEGSSAPSSLFPPSSGSGKLNRPLNSDERSGAYLLGAIVFGGLLLGGLSAPVDEETRQKRRERKEAKKAKKELKKAEKEGRAVVSSSTTPVAAVASDPAPASSTRKERGRVGKALDDIRGASVDGSANFSTGHNIVGGGPRKW
ncbi:hypothetical protein OC845_003482 [Tilletia horrida]|nr:hypothetical protein OC845_003482 [Tilletia horrida]